MQHQFTSSLLYTVSKGINSGDPTWTLLLANEYLKKDDPLRKALVMRAQKGKDTSSSEAFEAACAGKTLRELSNTEKSSVRENRAATLPRRKQPLPTPKSRAARKVHPRRVQSYESYIYRGSLHG